MGYWLSCDAATVSIRADTNMAQRIDSPDGAGVINIVAIELSRSTDRLISISTGNNPDNRRCLVTWGGLTRGPLPNPSNPINLGLDSPCIKTLLCGDAAVVRNPAVCNTKSALRQRLRMSVTIKKCNAISEGRDKKKNQHVVIKCRGSVGSDSDDT